MTFLEVALRFAEVAELADAQDSKSCPRKRVRVQFPPSALTTVDLCSYASPRAAKRNISSIDFQQKKRLYSDRTGWKL